jgi:EmrB/QacA subfamily drug resistance transporter
VPTRVMSQKAVCATLFAVSTFLRLLDSTIVTVALPAIGREFGTTPTAAAGGVTSFLVGTALLVPSAGWFGDRFGNKRVFLPGLAAFTVTSLLCGLAQNLTELVALRFLQGASGGLFGPIAMAMLVRAFPPSERISITRLLAIPISAAPLLGSVVGGFLVTTVSWRWIFLINVPVGVVLVLFGAVALRQKQDLRPSRFDGAGFVLSAVGFSLVMYAFNQLPSEGVTSPVVAGAGLLGLAMLVAFVLVSRRNPNPVVDLGLFKNDIFRISAFAVLLIMGSNGAAQFVIQLFFQNGLSYSPLRSGVDLAPSALGAVAGAQFAVRLYRAIGPRRLMPIAMVNSLVSLLLLATVDTGTPEYVVILIVFYFGFAGSVAFSSVQTTSFATMPVDKLGVASSLFNTAVQIGSAVGVAMLNTVLVGIGTTNTGGTANLAAYQIGLGIVGVIGLAGSLGGPLMRESEIAATRQKKPADTGSAGDITLTAKTTHRPGKENAVTVTELIARISNETMPIRIRPFIDQQGGAPTYPPTSSVGPPTAPPQGAGGYSSPAAPAQRSGGYSPPAAPAQRSGGYSPPAAPPQGAGGYSPPAAPAQRSGGYSPPQAAQPSMPAAGGQQQPTEGDSPTFRPFGTGGRLPRRSRRQAG